MTIKKIFKSIGYTIGFFIAFLLIYLLAAFTLSRISVNKEANSNSDEAIYILTNGVHTDIVVPVKNELIDWSKKFKFSHTLSKDTNFKYLGMGWGDKGFYLETPTWSDLKASVAFKAVSGLGATAIHATYYSSMTENSSCRKILISNEQYGRLIDYIEESLQIDSADNPINIITNANYGNTDAFYEAHGSYNLFYTCNTWANNALKACGQRCCLWTPFKNGIFLKYELK